VAYSKERRRQIFDKTDGNCHICGGSLCFSNYALHGRRGAWEVEHSKPKAEGGTDHLNNLYAAHIGCNRSKGKGSTRTARAKNGHRSAPRSAARKKKLRNENRLVGGTTGAIVGGLLGGPVGAGIGAFFGERIGADRDVESE